MPVIRLRRYCITFAELNHRKELHITAEMLGFINCIGLLLGVKQRRFILEVI